MNGTLMNGTLNKDAYLRHFRSTSCCFCVPHDSSPATKVLQDQQMLVCSLLYMWCFGRPWPVWPCNVGHSMRTFGAVVLSLDTPAAFKRDPKGGAFWASARTAWRPSWEACGSDLVIDVMRGAPTYALLSYFFALERTLSGHELLSNQWWRLGCHDFLGGPPASSSFPPPFNFLAPCQDMLKSPPALPKAHMYSETIVWVVGVQWATSRHCYTFKHMMETRPELMVVKARLRSCPWLGQWHRWGRVPLWV